MKYVFKDANFPMTAEGRTYHVGTKAGEVANRIITVGDTARAESIASMFEKDSVSTIHSARGFVTITGIYRNTRISIIAIGMGLPLMDFMVREVRAITKGPLAMIRFGSCGLIADKGSVGSFTVASDGSVAVTRNYDHFLNHKNFPPYNISLPVEPDYRLTNLMSEKLKQAAGADKVILGLNASADSFYSSQARSDPRFVSDDNENLLTDLKTAYPNLVSLEMETFMLLHLAMCLNGTSSAGAVDPQLKIHAAGSAMVFASRVTGDFVDKKIVEDLEIIGGKCCLDALVEFQFP